MEQSQQKIIIKIAKMELQENNTRHLLELFFGAVVIFATFLSCCDPIRYYTLKGARNLGTT
jgi:hypothetical protein